MGEPAIPTPEERRKVRDMAKAIIDSVRNDERMPYVYDAHRSIETLVFDLAMEIALLIHEHHG